MPTTVRRRFDLGLVLTFSFASTAAAQSPGEIGIFADAAGTESVLFITPASPFFVNAVAFDIPSSLSAYEVGIEGLSGAFVLSTELYGPEPLNVGDAATQDFVVGTGGCVPGAGTFALVSLTASAMTNLETTLIRIRGTNPSSFDGAPGWAERDGTTMTPFALRAAPCTSIPNGAVLLNSLCPVAAEKSTFGAVKARF